MGAHGGPTWALGMKLCRSETRIDTSAAQKILRTEILFHVTCSPQLGPCLPSGAVTFSGDTKVQWGVICQHCGNKHMWCVFKCFLKESKWPQSAWIPIIATGGYIWDLNSLLLFSKPLYPWFGNHWTVSSSTRRLHFEPISCYHAHSTFKRSCHITTCVYVHSFTQFLVCSEANCPALFLVKYMLSKRSTIKKKKW